MLIRDVSAKDIKELSAMAKISLSEGFSEDDFRISLENKNAIVLLCEENNEMLGYVVSYFAADEAELIQIAVRDKSRKLGIGSKLFLRLRERLQEQGIKKIFLEVRESNVPANSFYKGLGFIRVGRRPSFYKNPDEDALLLRLDILNA